MLVGGCDQPENEPHGNWHRQIALIKQRRRQMGAADLDVEG